jgi:hypothetical protein
MSDAFFRLSVILLLILNWFTAESAAQNAMEAHAHAHELACHVQAEDLCEFAGADHE